MTGQAVDRERGDVEDHHGGDISGPDGAVKRGPLRRAKHDGAECESHDIGGKMDGAQRAPDHDVPSRSWWRDAAASRMVRRNSICCAKAFRPLRVKATRVRGFLPTKSLATAM